MKNRSNGPSCLILGAMLCLLGLSAIAQSTVERKTLNGHVPKAVAGRPPLKHISGDTKIQLAIGLPLRDDAGLDRELKDLYDPASPNYHQYLTVEQFTERFGPTKEDYQAVMDFARTNGLTVRQTHPNRLLLEVEGNVSDVERTFHLKLNIYQHPTENRRFFAPDSEPSIPANVPVLSIEGLNDYIIPHTHGPQARAVTAHAPGFTKNGSGPNGYYIAPDLRAAYVPGVTNLGAGQKVALAEWEAYYTNDVYMYETNAGLSTSIVFTNILLPGATGIPLPNTGLQTIEPPLDIDAVMDMAPAAIIQVYIAPLTNSDYDGYFLSAAYTDTLYNRIATDNQAHQISTSWITGIDATGDNIFKEYAAQGQSFFNAAGDTGAVLGDIPPPSDDPYIIQVGGTILTMSGSGNAYSSEISWDFPPGSGFSFSASSGGVSDIYSIPTWQQGMNMVNNKGSQTMRNFPDIAIVAVNILCYNDGIEENSGGSSFAAPLWAGFTALVNQKAANTGKQPVGFMNPALYSIALSSGYNLAFHDITTGSNVNFTTTQTEWIAGTNFDLCTGLGTPNGSNMMNALLASPDPLVVNPNLAFTASGVVGGPFNYTTQNYTISNQSNASLTWSNMNPVTWLQVSTTHGTLAAGGTNLVTVSLSSAANSLAAGIYTTTIWFTNVTSHFAQGRQFALRVGQPVLQNGGFEDGDISYWLLTGDYNGYDDYAFNSPSGAFSGNYFMALTWNGGPLATLSQTLPTLPGQYYLVSFELYHDDYTTGFTNEFEVSWNGKPLMQLVNYPTLNTWSNYQFRVLATGPSSQLTFGADNDNDYFGLDAVTFTPTNGPPAFSNISVSNKNITLTWFTTPTTNYQLQFIKTLSLNNWSNLGSSFTATSNSATVIDSNNTNSQRFYRLIATP